MRKNKKIELKQLAQSRWNKLCKECKPLFKERTIIKYLNFILLVFFISGACIGCRNKKTNKQIFEENFDSNIEVCSKQLIEKGMDVDRAKSICSCGLKEMFEIDSTILALDQDKLNELYETNKDILLERCEELREEYFK